MKKTLFLLAILALPSSLVTAKTVNIEYILDASGSMLETIQDVRKIDIAKETLSGLIDQLPAGASEVDLNVGLRVYGHSTVAGESPEQRCRDTALEIPINGVKTAAIKQKIAGIQARGWTPIAYSLEQSAEDFPKGQDSDNIIILISDGKETCGGDPCAVAKKLHQAGIKVNINVVGFDINPAEKTQLECIAKAAGGKYYSADSAGELNRVLTEVQDQVIKKKSTSTRIKIGGFGNIHFEPADWVSGAPYRYQLEAISDGKVAASGIRNMDDARIRGGKYRLVWRQTEHEVGAVVLSNEIEIKPGETTDFKLNTGIHLAPAEWLKQPPYYWYLQDSDGKKIIQVGHTWDPVLVPAGVYELWYRQTEHHTNEVRLAENLEVKEGGVTEFDVNTGISLIPSNPKERAPYNWVLKPTDGKNSIVGVREAWGPVPAAPGKYSFSIRITEHGHSLTELVPEFTIKEGQLVELEL